MHPVDLVLCGIENVLYSIHHGVYPLQRCACPMIDPYPQRYLLSLPLHTELPIDYYIIILLLLFIDDIS